MSGTLVTTIFAVAGLLGLVSLLPPLARSLRLPLAVLLAAVGVALGSTQLLLGNAATEGLGALGDFLAALSELELSSSAFLYIFLPILLFEAALGVDVRRLMEDLWPVLLLAVVAVLVATFGAGFAMWVGWWMWHGEWSTLGLVVCLMLASIVATTDPAAVIGIFRDIGAPRRLTMLVEGESLFNDAAAIAIFTILLGILTAGPAGGAVDAGGAVLLFLVKFVGGIAVGLTMGRLVGWVVTPLRDMPQSEITLTVVLAYLSFILAENYLGVSGVVAVVTAGLVIASEGRTRISPESWTGLKNVWSQLGFWANSLIFLLASMLIPPTLMNATWGHAILLVALILGAFAARAAVICGLLPVLGWLKAADRISFPYQMVMLWGGLRGAVSLALALAVTENRAVPEQLQDVVAVVATGFVLFTLLVQGTTLRPLIRLFGLDRLTPVDLALRNRALGLSLGNVRQEIEGIARSFDLDPEPAVAPLLDRGASLAQEQLDLQAAGALTEDDRVYIGLLTLSRHEEEAYLRYFADGVVSRLTAQNLTVAAGRLQDGARTGRQAGYEAVAAQSLRLSLRLRLALFLHRRFGWRRSLARRLSERFSDLVVLRFAVRELKGFNADRLSRLLGHETAAILDGILTARLAGLDEAIATLELQYPTYVETVRSRYLQRAGLRFEERTLRQLHDEAVISREILVDLERDLARRRQDVEKPPELDLGLSTSDLLRRVPLFAGLSEDRLAKIETQMRPLLTVPDELIVRRGGKGDAMYFIASGAVAVDVAGLGESVRLGTGDFFGEMALVFDIPRNADVRSLGYCRLLVLEKRDFHRLYMADRELRDHINAVASRRQAAG